ncbi:Rieske (2Fe-2S) protein [Nonlabens xiamenensis]|uniref:Rieske (2Fe-2S) protein n=1 Tax=Nonlabens xiamenensis TaxID=2341043 RepID=UPI000F60D26B|nr:hypothetical protein [Nonlabens xiamenensis]
MRRILALLLLGALLACSSDDDGRQNPFLVDIGFQFDINTSLPQYSTLNFPGTSVVVNSAGIRGFVIYHFNNEQYVAYELSDPNHAPNSCSTMTISGIEATCPCTDDINKYNILTGRPIEGEGRFGMKAYRVVKSGNIIRVSN